MGGELLVDPKTGQYRLVAAKGEAARPETPQDTPEDDLLEQLKVK
jgi:hypothetical protein